LTRVKAKDKSEFQIGIGGASALAAPMFVKGVMFETNATFGAEGHLWCAVSCMESHVTYAICVIYEERRHLWAHHREARAEARVRC